MTKRAQPKGEWAHQAVDRALSKNPLSVGAMSDLLQAEHARAVRDVSVVARPNADMGAWYVFVPCTIFP